MTGTRDRTAARHPRPGAPRDAATPPRPAVKSDINVTPLVDVVLVLLIIFMVVTPLIASGVAVDLPRTRNHTAQAGRRQGHHRGLGDRGQALLPGRHARRRTRRELARRLADAQKKRQPDKTVFVKADTRAPYGAVRALMEALHEADIQDVDPGHRRAREATTPRR